MFQVSIPLGEELNSPSGAEVRILCDVDGFPVPQVTWLKNNLRLPSSNRISVEQDNTLVITGATPIGELQPTKCAL